MREIGMMTLAFAKRKWFLAAATSMLLLSQHASFAAQASGTIDKARLNQLLEILSTKSLAIPVPPEIDATRDATIREEYFRARKLRFDEYEARIDGAIGALVNLGPQVVDPLVGRLLQGGVSRAELEARVPRVLAGVGTPQAKGVLLELALGSDRFGPPNSEALCQYLEVAKGTEEARQLLISDDPDVFLKTLQAVPEISLDTQLLARLKSLLQASEHHQLVNVAIRQRSASIIARDTNTSLLREKVIALVESIGTVEHMPKAGDKFQTDRPGTIADNMYWYLVNALAKIDGADPYLTDVTESLTGKARSVVIVARALRGDLAVKPLLRTIVNDPNLANLTLTRHLAMKAFERVGTLEDIPFLQKISEDDSLEVIDLDGLVLEMKKGKCVNTNAEMPPQREASDPAWKRARRSYPIRIAAAEAIRIIEEKQKASANRY